MAIWGLRAPGRHLRGPKEKRQAKVAASRGSILFYKAAVHGLHVPEAPPQAPA